MVFLKQRLYDFAVHPELSILRAERDLDLLFDCADARSVRGADRV